MAKLIKAEIYKLFHSIYLWCIFACYLVLNSILLVDYIKRGMTCLTSSLYFGFFLFFIIGAIAVLFFGNEFDQRVIQNYVTAGNSRTAIFFAKVIVFLTGSVSIIVITLLIHALIGMIFLGEPLDIKTIVCLIPSFIATCTVPVFIGFLFKDIGKTLAGSLIFFVLSVASVNTKGIMEWAIYLPDAQRLLAYKGVFFDYLPMNIIIDVIWTIVFLIASYAVFCRSNLK
ncbi:MAG: ABC transporter permease [Lachnospiraceae bacterium]|nr:ABC transporter permease [Lachnospiraceae bacterium]